MPTSQKTFEQVKNILGKLDARIDTLRQRRAEPFAATGGVAGGASLSSPNQPVVPAAGDAATTSGFNPAGAANNGVQPGAHAHTGVAATIGPDTLIGAERPRGNLPTNSHTGNPVNQFVGGGGSSQPKPYGTGANQATPATETRQGPVPPGTPGRSPFGRATPIRPLSA